jgi:arylformamidase
VTRFYDVTLPIADGMIVYPGDRPVVYRRTHTIARDGVNLREIECGTHLGTHIDAPAHFIEGGATLDAIPLDVMLGEVEVVETDAPMIDRAALEKVHIDDWRAVFFKTRNQSLSKLDRFSEEYVSLTADAAKFLVAKGTRLVGIDYRSIECFETHHYPVHKILLGSGAFIVEGLCLNDVPTGRYRLHCLPMRLQEGDGGPVRAILSPLTAP